MFSTLEKNMVQMVFTGAATVQAALEFMTPGGRLIILKFDLIRPF